MRLTKNESITVEEEKPQSYNVDYIYKDLRYVTDTLFWAEQTFPYWETIYTLIIAGLLGLYLTSDKDQLIDQLIISVFGFVLSMFWFLLVRRMEIFSRARTARMRALERALQEALEEIVDCKIKIKNRNGIDKDNFEFCLFSLTEFVDLRVGGNSNPLKFWTWRTWTYRKLIPVILIILWICLMMKI